jgi:basic membrane protein A and related proteins
VVYDLGGKFDKSFNEAAYTGAERWAEETGGTYRDIEMQSEAQREQALRRLAEGARTRS